MTASPKRRVGFYFAADCSKNLTARLALARARKSEASPPRISRIELIPDGGQF
jgi:hypothetical protein